MGKIVILGSANAVPDENHANTHLLIQEGSRAILVDCPENPIVKLRQIGLTLDCLTDIILTHFHPDHVSGVPLLLMDLWLSGRRLPITIHGLTDTLDRMESMMNLYNWESWPGFFQVYFHRLQGEANSTLLQDDDFVITASPVKHLIPTVGIRIDFKRSGKVMVYSSDTEPCQNVVDLAHEADILIHESAGLLTGHSTPGQGGEVAQQAGVKTLYLIHYPTDAEPEKWIGNASQIFINPVFLAVDDLEIEMD
ncbi:MAG TPA: ribonuclease Z [Longilinea sp.]|nr:ribonuclease Z [Longilinea sp.]